MPSDARLADVMRALAPPIAHYRSAVAVTLEEVRGYVAARHADTDAVVSFARELGQFAEGRIDAARLASLIGTDDPLAPAALAHLNKVSVVLADILARGDALFHLDVARGEDLTAAVRSRLALVGSAFGASRAAAAVRGGELAAASIDVASVAEFPFAQWSRAERALAPPLIVSVAGADLSVAGLAEFLDGVQKIVLLVGGASRPAPLVRLITPGLFVMQAHAVADLERVAHWPGAAIAAVMPESAARFVHDPSAGPELWQRVALQSLPPAAASSTSGVSASQQAEEVAQLQALAARPAGVAADRGAVEGAPVDPVDRLAAWLLSQADIHEAGGAS